MGKLTHSWLLGKDLHERAGMVSKERMCQAEGTVFFVFEDH